MDKLKANGGKTKEQTSQQKRSNLVFVYGTLMKGQSNHEVMKTIDATFVKNMAMEHAKMYDLGPFPMVVEAKESNAIVYGEQYAVDDAGLEYLDQLEGHPYMFKRVFIRHEDDTLWLYVAADERFLEGSDVVPSGIWSEVKEEKKPNPPSRSITIVKDNEGYLYIKEKPEDIANVYLECQDTNGHMTVSMALPKSIYDRYYLRIDGSLSDSLREERGI